MHELAPDVYVAEVVRDPPVYAFANSLIVVGQDGVLVVDTQQSLSAARALITEIRRLTDAPVRWVVNTHWHGDHVNGNQVYAQEYPGAEFIAHATLGDDLSAAATLRAAERVELARSIAARRQWLLAGTGPDGAPLSAADRAAVQRSLRLREAYGAELADILPARPTRTFADRLELAVGRHRVRLLYAGPAHTRGDVLVALPEHGILGVGDLLEAGLPYFADAYPAGWRRAVQQIAALRPAIIVPAHGPVGRDSALVSEMTVLLDAILRHSADATAVASADAGGSAVEPFGGLGRLWADRYGTPAASFERAMETAVARARLERKAR